MAQSELSKQSLKPYQITRPDSGFHLRTVLRSERPKSVSELTAIGGQSGRGPGGSNSCRSYGLTPEFAAQTISPGAFALMHRSSLAYERYLLKR